MQRLRLAYIISAYKLPANLIRLVDALDDEESAFAVGVDRGTPRSEFSLIREAFAERPNIQLLKRHRSPYRSFGHVKTTLKGLAHLRKVGDAYDYVSLLTGQDYPLKPPAEMREFLGSQAPWTFVGHFRLPSPRWGPDHGGMARIGGYHIHLRSRFYVLPRRIPGVPKFDRLGLAPWGGSGYWTMSGEHARYCLEYVESHPRYVRFFKHTDIPDELFFQTILLNSPYADQVVDDDLRCIDWSADPAPSVLTMEDWPRLRDAKNDLFARKFDLNTDADVMARIDEELLGRRPPLRALA